MSIRIKIQSFQTIQKIINSCVVVTLALVSLNLHANTEAPLRVLLVSAEHKGDHETGGLGAMIRFFLSALNQRTDTRADLLTVFYMNYYDNPDLSKQLKEEKESYHAFLNFHYDESLVQLVPDLRSSARFDLFSRELVAGKSKAFYLRHHNPMGLPNYYDNRVESGERKRYTPKKGSEYETRDAEFEAFGAINIAMAQFIRTHAAEYDLVIFNDWHTGLTPYFVYNPNSPQNSLQESYFHITPEKLPPSLFIIHNAAHQGWYPREFVNRLGVNWIDFNSGMVSKDGALNSMWTGLQYATVSRTVSRTHAEELWKYGRLGRGLQGLIHFLKETGRWTGGINGIPDDEWSPEQAEKFLSQVKVSGEALTSLDQYRFSASDLTGKDRGKGLLQEYFGLKVDPKSAVIVMTARLDRQKGFEFLLDAVENTLQTDAAVQFVFVGDGDAGYRNRILDLMKLTAYQGRITWAPWSDERERIALLYGTFLLAPSIDEPSGQVHLFGKTVGTPFIGTLVGGPVESVKEGKTGFFSEFKTTWCGNEEVTDSAHCSHELSQAISRAMRQYRDPVQMREMVRNTMEDAPNYHWKRLMDQERLLLKYVAADGPRTLRDAGITFPDETPTYSKLWSQHLQHQENEKITPPTQLP